jgi:uncharacterized tellurite resistance protein B-like protein
MMLDALRRFIVDVGGLGDHDATRFGEEDYRLAAAALLVHVVNADGTTAAVELARLKSVVEATFGLDAAETAALLKKAEECDREAVDFYRFTSVLKRTLDDEGRRKIVEMMFDVAVADGVIDELEESSIWRVAELLGVSTRERVLLRQRIATEAAAGAPGDGAFSGPWPSPKPTE